MEEESNGRTKKQGNARATLFRISYRHQGQLIRIADYKAGLIISISTMIISAIFAIIGFGVVSGKDGVYNFLLLLPMAIIVVSSLIALIYAIRAARPKFISSTNHSSSPTRSSLLFFRTIASYSQNEYLDKMKELFDNEEEVFEQMTLDLYNQGVVLKIKYDLLRVAFSAVLYGFVLSAAAFIIMMIIGYRG